LPLLDIAQFLKDLLHPLHLRVLAGSTNIDPAQRNGMGIEEAHVVASALLSSFQCAHYLNLIEHDLKYYIHQ